MKKTEEAGYMNFYLPLSVLNAFREHCKKNGLVMGATVCMMIKEYLEKNKNMYR